LTVLAFLCALTAGCGGRAGQPLSGSGSTFIAPLMNRWQADYAGTNKGKITYESVGSVVGVRRLGGGVLDFACTDAPLGEEQLRALATANGEVVHIPLVLGAVVPAYNLPEVTEPLTPSGPVLADIYLGRVTRWNEPAIRDLNPGAALPDREIAVIHRGDGSGTTYIWSDYLSKVSPAWREKVGSGVSLTWPVGKGVMGNEGTAAEVRKTPGAIAYLPLAYAARDDVQPARVKNAAGRAVRASAESVTAAGAALADLPDDLRYSLTDAPGPDSYPISGTVWAVVFVKQPPGKGRALVEFLRWATHEGQEQAAELRYARLPPGLVERVDKKLDRLAAHKP
jgi:phosphate transport system substrate-binding protein